MQPGRSSRRASRPRLASATARRSLDGATARIILQAKRDALAAAPYFANLLAPDAVERRLGRAQQERTGYPDPGQPLSQDALFQRRDINDDVRQLRQAAHQLANFPGQKQSARSGVGAPATGARVAGHRTLGPWDAATPTAGPQAHACGFHEEARHSQARKREQLQLLTNVRPGFHPHSGGVISSTRYSMKFGPGGAARSVSASKAGRRHAVAANTVCDVLCRCRCSPVSITKANRSSSARASCYVVLVFIRKRDQSSRLASLARAAAPPACGLPLLLLCAWRSCPRGRPAASPNAAASSPRPRDPACTAPWHQQTS